MVKIITNFSRLTDTNLVAKAQQVITSMTGNANFPTPNPAIADVQTALTDYTEALGNMGNGGRQQTEIKNQKRVALQTIMSALAKDVQDTCKNDPAIALSSGFSLAKSPTPVGALPAPDGLKVTITKPGEVNLQVIAVKHAVGYVWQYKAAADTDWKDAHSTKAKATITGLTSGTQYTFRATALGTNPSYAWCNPVSVYAQ